MRKEARLEQIRNSIEKFIELKKSTFLYRLCPLNGNYWSFLDYLGPDHFQISYQPISVASTSTSYLIETYAVHWSWYIYHSRVYTENLPIFQSLYSKQFTNSHGSWQGRWYYNCDNIQSFYGNVCRLNVSW